MKAFHKNDPRPDDTEWVSYKKKTIVEMTQVQEDFICESREGNLLGKAGDFVAEDGHGGYYPISAEFHAKNYEAV